MRSKAADKTTKTTSAAKSAGSSAATGGTREERVTAEAPALGHSQNTAATLIVELDKIAERAYELWQLRGCTHGFDREDWLQAEQELAG